MFWTFKQISLKEIIDLFVNSNHVATIFFVLFSIIIISLHTLRWKLIIKTTGHNIPFFKVLQYKIIGVGVSFITPGAKVGGEPIRAMLLSRHNVEFHKGLSTIITDKIVDLSVQGVMFVIAAVIAVTTLAMPKDMSYSLIFVAIFFSSLIIYTYYQIFNDKNLFLKLFKLLRLNKIQKFSKIEHKVVEFEKYIVSFHKEHNTQFYLSILITITAWICMFGEYYFALRMISNFPISIMQIFMIITMVGAAYLVPIPMALGVFEAGQITIFKVLNLSVAIGVGLAMVIRARDILWTLIGFIFVTINGITWKTIKEDKLIR